MTEITQNPILKGLVSPLPLFDEIKPEHVLPALGIALTEARQLIASLSTLTDPTWHTLMQPLEALEEKLSRIWGPVVHLNAVCDSAALRPVYQKGVAKMAEWHAEMGQNEALYVGIKKLRDRADFMQLSIEQQQVIEHTLRDFRLSGAELEGADKDRFKVIQMRQSELSTQFSQHVLDATQAFELHVIDPADLAGLPESVQAAARQRAEEANKDGCLFTLDAPSWVPFMQFSENRSLRQQMYSAFSTRASSGQWDNSPIIDELLKLRSETAALLGFDSYSVYSLATKMADEVSEVTDFLRQLSDKSKVIAEQEVEELRAFAVQLGLPDLEAWDVAFVSEKLRLQTYAISQEDLKPYFPENHVIAGMFGLVEQLYGIRIKANNSVALWHASVRFFEVFDSNDEQIAAFYLDPYARSHKRGGAWMDECIVRWQRSDGTVQLPVAYLVCNFDAPVGGKPALWTHDEVTTLFHEFGHGLHHMLTQVSELSVSGIRGVPWDAVELPSQFMENFCWEREVVDLFARHYKTGETLPDCLFDKMLAAKNFHSAMQMQRQIELSLFDIVLHDVNAVKENVSVQAVLDVVRDEVAVLQPPSFNRFQNSFSHIFAGGYAAGYFSYKWAEVLSADVYAAFEDEGILNTDTATRFRQEILSIGGSRNIMDAFVAFRDRKPTVDALLHHAGLSSQTNIGLKEIE